MRTLLTVLGLTLATIAHAEERWVTLGAAVTETVFALGAGDRVVGADESSLHPAAAAALPRVGAHHHVSTEAILALRPTRVIAAAEVGPPATFEQLAAAGVPVVQLDAALDLDAARARIHTLAAIAGAEEAGAALAGRIDAAADAVTPLTAPVRVAFVYARGAGTMMLGGRGTAVASVIEAAGGTLAASWDGFRPVTAEGVVAAAPDVWLLTTRGLDSLGGVDGLMAVPGVALTPAGETRRVVTIDDLVLLSLGPRTDEAITTLHTALVDVHGEAGR